ncbi:YihY/virulence factor BrkB family protein [Peribacillus muralis]|uniref:YihY/virulence factor BrkB family protein n=1 Tax=Peribacillus muralis TaxID=264697 RepID=UPI000709C4AF|nr:YihY/virulence factor BrkB family protein [Peribacillus muralis]MCK1994021.1 YihY/virulence factor BrkB family protein [Peribacillus muralis]MCK2014576.1 YihY/virulence factor BrkB family protein [Peribacillus muralis]
MAGKKEWLKGSFFKSFIKRLQMDEVTGLAAQLSYFFLLSLFPLLIFLFTLLAYLPFSQEDILNSVRTYAPADSMKIIEANLADVMEANGTLLSFSIIGTIWSASNGMNAIIKAFNHAYGVKESRTFFISRGMSILLTLAMIFVFIVVLLLPVFGKQIGLLLFAEIGQSDEFLAIWNQLRWAVSTCVFLIVFTSLYWIAPNIKLKCLTVLPGAIFATAGWCLVSFLFSFYVDKFANYSATYGSLGGIIVLMVWFYLSGLIIILGGEINALLSEKKNPDCE